MKKMLIVLIDIPTFFSSSFCCPPRNIKLDEQETETGRERTKRGSFKPPMLPVSGIAITNKAQLKTHTATFPDYSKKQ